jgi:hypothetical protein
MRTFNYTFQIAHAKRWAETLSTQSWEIGTTAEAILELISPEKAVFAPAALKKGKVPFNWFKMDEALVYVHGKVRLTDGPTLVEDAYSVSDPASLGVSAVLIGQHWPGWGVAAGMQKEFLLEQAPRYANGAISHRVEVPEVWADGVSMFPPFLAYYGVSKKNVSLVKESVRQIELYRDVLRITEGKRKGLWMHVVGPDNPDPGAWSTGNGWAAYGMLRTRATIAAWEKTRTSMAKEIAALDSYVLELLEAVIHTDDHESGLLRNYLSEEKWWPEAAGTTLLTASAYRMVMVMEPSERRTKLIKWADRKRKVVAAHVNDDGIVMPTVNPYGHNQELPSEGYSPEAAAFLLLMGSAWRDCVCAGVCGEDS